MYIAFFDDGVVQTEGGSVLWEAVGEAVEEVINVQENIGRHRDTIDWDAFTVYEVGDKHGNPVDIDDIRHYFPLKRKPVSTPITYTYVQKFPSLNDPSYYY